MAEISKRRLERNIKLGYLSEFVISLTFIIPIWFAFETKFASPATLGLIYAFNHLFTVVWELPTGAIADMLGRKKTVILGSIIQGLAWIYLSQAKNEGWLWIGYAVDAVGIALLSGAFTALIYDSYKELGREKEFSKYSSQSALLLRLGLAGATFLGGWVFGINERLPYFLSGLVTILGGLILVFAVEPRVDTEKFNLRNYFRRTKDGVRELFKTPLMRYFSLYYLLVGGITWYFLYFLNIAYATEVGFNDNQRSIVFGLIYIIGAVINILIVRWRWGHKTILWMFPILMIGGYGIGGLVSPIAAIMAIFMVQLAGAARFSLLDQMANDEIESRQRATALSVLNMLVSIVYAILSIGGGKIIDNLGTPVMMMGLAIISAVTIIPMAIKLTEEIK